MVSSWEEDVTLDELGDSVSILNVHINVSYPHSDLKGTWISQNVHDLVDSSILKMVQDPLSNGIVVVVELGAHLTPLRQARVLVYDQIST